MTGEAFSTVRRPAARPGRARGVVDEASFTEAMSLLAAPVTVVTTCDRAGRPRGFTASSVASVSLRPPRLLVGLAHTSSCYEAFTTAEEFVLHLLTDRLRETATRFATHGADRFAGTRYAPWPGTDLPLLAGAHAALRCLLVQRIKVGDHDLLIGEPTAVRTDGDGVALTWYRRAFHLPSPAGDGAPEPP